MPTKERKRKMQSRLALSMLALAVTMCAAPSVNHSVNVSYYGVSDFSVAPAITHLNPGDTVTFSSDDPGTLYLRLGDDGTLYRTQNNQMTFTARQIQQAGVDKIRCSLVLADDTVLGWEAVHHSRKPALSKFSAPWDEVTPGSEAVTDQYGGTVIVGLAVPGTLWDRILNFFGVRGGR